MVSSFTAIVSPFLLNFISNLVEQLLAPFYESVTVDELMLKLPSSISKQRRELIKSRWPFFNKMRAFTLSTMGVGFPATSLFKTKIQTMYNTLKGGLDCNTQQFSSIMPPIKVSFKQKYIVHMLLGIVINAWRAYQILGHTTDLAMESDQFCFQSYKKSLSNHSVTLREFNVNLAMGLIKSAENTFFQNVLFSDVSNTRQVVAAATNCDENLGFQRNPTTLSERLRSVVWPKRYRLEAFCKKQTFIELRLMHNTMFRYVMAKINRSKSRKVHCALCHFGQTEYGCNLCKVTLCKAAKINSQYETSCFVLWHKHKDLLAIKNTLQEEWRKQKQTERNKGNDATSGSDGDEE
jgi:hypothetical protein